jgi:hypothetical protein
MYQRTLLQDSPTWLERHTARASSLLMQTFHDSTNAVGSRLHQRERTSTTGLSPTQRMKFLSWAEKNAERLRQKFQARRQAMGKEKESDEFKISASQHTAAKLYILNDRLQKLLAQFPPQVELVNTAYRKRLSRRPSFESLGQQKDENGSPMTRENSFASSDSLKRSVSSLSMVSENGEEKAPEQVSPEDGEGTAAPLIEKELGFVKHLIPPIVQPVPPPAPAPAPVSLPPAPQPYSQHHYAPPPAPHMSHHHHHQPPSHPYAMAPHHHQQQVTTQTDHIHHMPPPQTSAPAPVAHYQHYYDYGAPAPVAQPQPVYAQPQLSYAQSAPQLVYSAPPPAPGAEGSMHVRKNSFLPPHLNVVPEEMFPAADGSEDFLMNLIDDGDWAIGEGVDMDMAA